MPQERPSYVPAGAPATAAAAGPGSQATAVSDNPVLLNATIAAITAAGNRDRQQAVLQACMQAKGYSVTIKR